MSARTGLRRARVLLALTLEGRSVNSIATQLGLHYRAVSDIVDALILADLADFADGQSRGVRLASGPQVDDALDEAWTQVRDAEARGVGA